MLKRHKCRAPKNNPCPSLLILLPCALQQADFAFDNQNFLLLKFLFQRLLEICRERARTGGVLTDHPINHDLVAIRQVAEFPESLIRLRKKRQPLEVLQKPALQILKSGRSKGVSSL
ncbi:MAG: hypothetical protein KIS67_16355 [Verrucomicrobiae bacterium]|nr:hypothetical protein [Verrucomicrobiae bacterium]